MRGVSVILFVFLYFSGMRALCFDFILVILSFLIALNLTMLLFNVMLTSAFLVDSFAQRKRWWWRRFRFAFHRFFMNRLGLRR